MGQPYASQLDGKVARTRQLLGGLPAAAAATWLAPMASAESGFRNKAKMVVGGTVAGPTLGILDEHQHGVDLRHCGICAPELHAAFPVIADFITRAGLVPYDVPTRRGELKHVLVTVSAAGELMVRFVLRSTEPLLRMRKHLASLRADLPSARVITVNLQPEHKAVLEGPDEIVLTDDETLPMTVDGVTLHLRAGSFFQTNTAVAAGLYAQARAWADVMAPTTVWDLYCGVGGFALSVAAPGRRVLGVEVSAPAVASARLSAAAGAAAGLGAGDSAGVAGFVVDDATAYAERSARHDIPDLVIVNPPRRGLGERLASWLERSGAAGVIYSSCNVESLARDLAAMPAYDVRQVRVFDMFPQTGHFEVMVLLTRRVAG